MSSEFCLLLLFFACLSGSIGINIINSNKEIIIIGHYKINELIKLINLLSLNLSLCNCQIDTFVAVYKKLTGKDVVFEFPEVL